jgi:hypothetical protein
MDSGSAQILHRCESGARRGCPVRRVRVAGCLAFGPQRPLWRTFCIDSSRLLVRRIACHTPPSDTIRTRQPTRTQVTFRSELE